MDHRKVVVVKPIRRRIYEWPHCPDGTQPWVELDLDPRVSILGAPQPHPVTITVYWRQGPPTHDAVIFDLKAFSDELRRAVMPLSYNDHLTLTQRRMLIGFLLDAGVNDHPRDTSELLWGVRDRKMAPCPRWVKDEDWENRYVSFHSSPSYGSRYLGHIRDLRISKKTLSSKSRIEVSWSTETFGYSTIYVQYPNDSGAALPPSHSLYDLHNEPDERSALQKACDLLCSAELLLPVSAREEWESANAKRGRFLIPSEEEVQVFKILDEPLPFFWKEGLVEFLLERQG